MGTEQRFEAEALRRIPNIPRPDDDNMVTTPTLRLFDEEAHVMIIDDAGLHTRTLKEILINETLLEPPRLEEHRGRARSVPQPLTWVERAP